MRTILYRRFPGAVTRKSWTVGLLAVFGVTMLAGPGPAAATVGDLACTVSSTITYSPGITLTPSNQTVTWSVQYSGCTSTTGATVTTGSRGGSITRERSCLAVEPPLDGTRTITWNDATTSVVDSTGLAVDAGGQTVYTITGTVISGRFTGDTFLEVVTQSSLNLLACATTGVTSQTGTGAVTFA
ncbi:MAG TPA: hypothetical protein VFV67_04340 [Actinophytocola sp.]|uniref:hypothetical protein n=1 Tax=Actinophytocola sp. TaxID=1872138 RepID=UPI002DBE0432|nr:hypothetical protein [Actinophytocola sp.]HEU5469858.1 hypothetical protein [Actinophytocola sp.]